MRVEPHDVGSIMHVIQFGTRGSDIVRNRADQRDFVRTIFYANDSHMDPHWRREVESLEPPERPTSWPERDPLVHILAWTLLSNHFHLLLQETREGGIAKFMQRLCGSMTACFNAKYKERGSLFQGGYHGIVVDEQAHLQYLVFYILVKNVLDVYPGGLLAASRDFDRAWAWARDYTGSSLGSQLAHAASPILDDPDGLVSSVIDNTDYAREARELLAFHLEKKGEDFTSQMLEPW